MRVWTAGALGTILFFSSLLLSFFLAKEIRGGVEERYLLPTRMYLLFVPRDLSWGLSDIGFVNTLAFLGYSLERGPMKRETALKVYDALYAVTLYNPRYFDPYYVGNAFLTWETGLYREAIDLLKRGMRYVNDWRIPFYIGFNYFYFLGDNLKGAKYLSLAAKHPQAREYNLLPLLASRLYYEEGKLEVALALLREQLKVMKSESMKGAIRVRIVTLERAKKIYEAMRVFERRFGRKPRSLEELVRAGLVPKDIRDGAGGRFYITPDGKVRSERVLFPIRKKALEKR